MTYAGLTFEQWNSLSEGAAHRMAREIAGRYDLTVAGVEGASYAGRSHRVALFDRGGMRFALVPGGRPTLGYDGARLQPSTLQAESYADSADEYELPPLIEYVESMTSPTRSAELPAMLVAVEAFDPCRIPLAADDPQVLELVASISRRRGTLQTFESGGGLHVEFDQDGQVAQARAIRRVTYDEGLAGLAAMGLRTVTPDEWEWACGAGAATLFRWGDESLDDDYPSAHEIGPHRQANLWGLTIGQDPYRHEVTTERTVVCGGDGGSTSCGGAGFFLGWLTLATAYRDKQFGDWLASDGGYANEIRTRPVIDLS